MTATKGDNRRATYDRRIAAATTDRARTHALVWWWLAEVKRLPAAEQAVAFKEFEVLAEALNRRGAS